MRILVVADGIGSEIYDGAISQAFTDLGHHVRRFTWKDYFQNYQYLKSFGSSDNKKNNISEMVRSVYFRVQNKLSIGPVISRINQDLIGAANDFRPDIVFIYRGIHIKPETIKALKINVQCQVYGYNNDDPFSIQYPKYFWRHFISSIYEYDHIFCYRQKNIHDYLSLGYSSTSLLRSYYLKENNYFMDLSPISDVVFIGHFENDGRDESLKKLIDAGFVVDIHGPHWENSKHYDFFVNYLGRKISPVFGSDYNKVINLSKIALVFYSKLNNDTYTRRCFEIPATKRLMLAEYTRDMAEGLFYEGLDADYFRNDDELVEKVTMYLLDDILYSRVSDSGYNRLKCDGHEVIDRVKQVLKIYNNENI